MLNKEPLNKHIPGNAFKNVKELLKLTQTWELDGIKVICSHNFACIPLSLMCSKVR